MKLVGHSFVGAAAHTGRILDGPWRLSAGVGQVSVLQRRVLIGLLLLLLLPLGLAQLSLNAVLLGCRLRSQQFRL